MRVKLSIFRFDPNFDKQPRYDKFEINIDQGDTLLSALIKIYEEYEPSLSFRFACGKVKCGECSLMVNKSPCLACNRKIEPEMIVEPLPNLPIIKDLVIDRNKVFNRIKELAPSLLESAINASKTFESSVVDTYIKFTSCFECLICQSVCPVLKKNDNFTGPLGLLWLAQADLVNSNITKKMSNILQMCKRCGQCWSACPSEVKFLEDAITGLLSKISNTVKE